MLANIPKYDYRFVTGVDLVQALMSVTEKQIDCVQDKRVSDGIVYSETLYICDGYSVTVYEIAEPGNVGYTQTALVLQDDEGNILSGLAHVS